MEDVVREYVHVMLIRNKKIIDSILLNRKRIRKTKTKEMNYFPISQLTPVYPGSDTHIMKIFVETVSMHTRWTDKAIYNIITIFIKSILFILYFYHFICILSIILWFFFIKPDWYYSVFLFTLIFGTQFFHIFTFYMFV